MSDRLKGKRAIVTGAARGLGLACAKRFAQEGASVLLSDVDSDEGARALHSLAEFGSAVRFEHCDVSSRDQLERLAQSCIDGWGGIDLLLNNAGVAVSADILAITEEELERVLTINLKSYIRGTQIVATQMVSQGTGGVILNMSSVNAVLNIPHLVSYNIAKGGVNQLTSNTAIALAPYGIRVCGIGPGTVLTELTRNAVWTDEAARKSILSRTPIGRAGEPEEIASIAAFLASEDASYITGETIYADGGRRGLNYTVPVV